MKSLFCIGVFMTVCAGNVHGKNKYHHATLPAGAVNKCAQDSSDLAEESNGMPDINFGVNCTSEVICCRGNTSVCVGQDPTVGCNYCGCPDEAKLPWEREEVSKTRLKGKYNDNVAANKPPSYKDVFGDDDVFKAMTDDARKNLKQGLFRMLRTKNITVDVNNEGDYEMGGFKAFNGFKKQKKVLSFKMIDSPAEESEPVEVLHNELFLFEGDAEFKYKKKNFNATTQKKSAADGWHKTSFTDKDTGESCEIEGSAASQACKIGTTRIEVYFSGSVAGAISEVDCLEQATPNTVHVSVVSEKMKYHFNDIAYNSTRYIGVTSGVYTFTDIPEEHPLGIASSLNTSLIEVLSCSGTTYQGNASTHDDDDVKGTFPDTTFCTGTLKLKVHSDFNMGSVVCFKHGYMGGMFRLMYDDTCPIVVEEEDEVEDEDKKKDEVEDEDDNMGIIVGATIGSLAFIGFGLWAVDKTGYAEIFGRYDPIINNHLVHA